MKKILALTLALIMCAFCFASCGNTNDDTTDVKTLTIGYTDYAPMNYEENGKLVGFDTEFAEAVCAKLGMEPKFQLIDWGNKYMEVDSGNIDCIWNGFTFNCADSDGVQRTDKVDVSYAYMNNEQCVVVKVADLANYATADALADKLLPLAPFEVVFSLAPKMFCTILTCSSVFALEPPTHTHTNLKCPFFFLCPA